MLGTSDSTDEGPDPKRLERNSNHFCSLFFVEHSLIYFLKCHAAYQDFFLLFVWSLMYSLCSRRFKVICRKEGARDRDTTTPILSCAHYFQASATHRLLMYHWYVPYMLRKRMIEIFLCEIQPQLIDQRQCKNKSCDFDAKMIMRIVFH